MLLRLQKAHQSPCKKGGFGSLPLQSAARLGSACTHPAPRGAQGAQQSTWLHPGHSQTLHSCVEPSVLLHAVPHGQGARAVRVLSNGVTCTRAELLAPLGPQHIRAQLPHHSVLKDCRAASCTMHTVWLSGKARESWLPLAHVELGAAAGLTVHIAGHTCILILILHICIWEDEAVVIASKY